MTEEIKQTPVRKKAKQLAKILRKEYPNYDYLRELFRHLRKELDVQVTYQLPEVPYIPTEEEISKYYQAVWQSRNMKHVTIVKTFLYTGIKVGELVKVQLSDIDLDKRQIKIIEGVGKKDRIVPFPENFKEILAFHMSSMQNKGAKYLFESSWKRPYSDRGIRKILAYYAKEAGITESISPTKLRGFLFTWLRTQGIEDASIQPYSGHELQKSLERYGKLSTAEVQKDYENIIKKFPV